MPSARASIIRANKRILGEGGPDGDRTLAETEPAVGDERGGVGAVLGAQAFADRAPAERAVEREVVRRQLLEAPAAAVARAMLAVAVDGHCASAMSSSTRATCTTPLPRSSAASTESASRERVARRTTARSMTTSTRCFRRWLDLRRLVEADRLPSTRTRVKPGAAKLVPERLVRLAVAALDGSHHVDLRAFGQVQHLLDDLVGRLRADRLAAARAMRLAQPGEQDAQIVVDLGHRADRRARALARRLLLDGDGRRQPGDLLDLRLLQRSQELAGVARQAFDVAPLALGVERVDRQRALARAAGAAADASSCARDVDVDPLQIVLPRAADRDRREAEIRRAAVRFAGATSRLR